MRITLNLAPKRSVPSILADLPADLQRMVTEEMSYLTSSRRAELADVGFTADFNAPDKQAPLQPPSTSSANETAGRAHPPDPG